MFSLYISSLKAKVFFAKIKGRLKAKMRARKFMIYAMWRFRNHKKAKAYSILDRYVRLKVFIVQRKARDYERQFSEEVAELSSKTGVPQHEIRAIFEMIVGD